MLKLLIVDDEILTIRMLEKLIDWECFGIKIIATAENGNEAYEKFLIDKPDIIITDIKMPECSGIKFMQKIKGLGYDVDFIIMSAYADFEYARKAIGLGCFGYILKPIDENELISIIKKITSKISNKQVTNKIIVNSRIQSNKRILYNYMKTGANILDVKNSIKNLNYEFDNYYVISINVNNETIDQYNNLKNLMTQQLNYIAERIEEITNKYGKSLIFDFDNNSWILLVSEVNEEIIVNCVDDMHRILLEQYKINTKICFSSNINNIELLPADYQRILKLNRYSFYVNSRNNIFGYGYNCNLEEFDKLQLLEAQKNIIDAIKQSKVDDAMSFLHDVLETSKNINPISLSTVYEFCLELIVLIRRLLNNMENVKDNDTKLKDIIDISYTDLICLNNIEELQKFMFNVLRTVVKIYKNNNESDKFSISVERSIGILNCNYNKNISLDDICEEISVSKTYFCYIFKRETGKNLWTYLTEIRMDKAREFLENTNLKSYEIAYKVGYDNPSYFSKIFKQMNNMTPNEYKTNYNNRKIE